MDFDLSDEQRLIKESVDRLAAREYDFESRSRYLSTERGWSPELWQQFADLGLLALPFSEADGGMGGSAVETMIVMEAVGRQLMVEPYLATVILGGGVLKFGGSDSQRAELIPRIADGSLLLAFAQAESQSRYSLTDVTTSATRDGDGWRLSGRKRYVLHGDCADKLIVVARTAGDSRGRDGITLFIVDADSAGISRRGYLTQDRQRAADIRLDGVRVGPEAVIGTAGEAADLLARVVQIAVAALCAEAVGAMERAHELTVEYLKTRKQFGVTIGSFQALQHRAVDMLVTLEQARSMSYLAAMMADEENDSERSRAMSAAKIQIGKSARFVGQQAIQLHGGIGVTEECQVGHYFRRLSMIEIMFGDVDHHVSALAAAGGLLAPSQVA